MPVKPTRLGRDKKQHEAKMAAGETSDKPFANLTEEALQQISTTVQSALDDRFIKIQAAVEDIKGGLEGHSRRLDATEQRISSAEDRLQDVERQLAALQGTNAALRDRVEDQENRGRRNNLKIIGLPETLRDDGLYRFVEKWLPEALGLRLEGDTLRCERVHRLGPVREEGGKPRPVMARIMNWAHKTRLMQLYRQKRELAYEGGRILLFSDFSPHVAALRREMAAPCSELYKRGMRFTLLYPAKLRVNHGNTVRFFANKGEAEAFIRTLPAE